MIRGLVVDGHTLIPLASFSRLVKTILLRVAEHSQSNRISVNRVTNGFLECLQAATEVYIRTVAEHISKTYF